MSPAPLAPAVAAHRGPLERARADYLYIADWLLGGAWHHLDAWADGLDHRHADCAACAKWSRYADAASIALDMAVAEAHPAPDWRAFQETVWTRLLEETLKSEVAWA